MQCTHSSPVVLYEYDTYIICNILYYYTIIPWHLITIWFSYYIPPPTPPSLCIFICCLSSLTLVQSNSLTYEPTYILHIYIYIWMFLMLFWSPYWNLTLKLSCFLSIVSLYYWIVQKIFLQLFSCYIREIICINNFLSCWLTSGYGYIRQALWISHKYQLWGVRCFLPKTFWCKYFIYQFKGCHFPSNLCHMILADMFPALYL